jgi:Tfp pilus assembly protein PilF
MKNAAVLVLALFVFTSCASKKDKMREKKADLYFGAGTQSLISGQYTDALTNLLKANKLKPNNSDVLNNLGMAYYFKGEKEIAVKMLKKSLEISKGNSDARNNLASIYYKAENYDQAEKLYKEVLSDLTYDKSARVYYNLGMLEVQARHNIVKAENYFKKSIKEDDNYCPAYHQLGVIQYGRRQYTPALNNFKEATMGSCYESPAPHYYQALTFIELKRFDEARLKLDEIDTKFKKSVYAVKARSKVLELDDIENRSKTESHASRNVLETPEF